MPLTSLTIRPFDESTDLLPVVAFYNDVFAPLRPIYSWPLTVERFRDKVLLNWEFRPEGFWLAFDGERLVGMVLASSREMALCEMDRAHVKPPVAYLSVIAVAAMHRRQGIGRALLEQAETFARGRGCRMITPTANPLAPMAFFITPQGDWAEAAAFFPALGYQHKEMQQNLVRNLVGFEIDARIAQRISELEAQGYECRPYRDEDHDSLLAMQDWPYWVVDIESKLGRWTKTRPFIETCFLNCATEDIAGPEEICVVVKDGQVLAFCVQTINRQTGWAYLGPVMTLPAVRNQGLASVALQLSLQQAVAHGANMCDLWTDLDEHHTRFYNRNGFQRVMCWQRYEKPLG